MLGIEEHYVSWLATMFSHFGHKWLCLHRGPAWQYEIEPEVLGEEVSVEEETVEEESVEVEEESVEEESVEVEFLEEESFEMESVEDQCQNKPTNGYRSWIIVLPAYGKDSWCATYWKLYNKESWDVQSSEGWY